MHNFNSIFNNFFPPKKSNLSVTQQATTVYVQEFTYQLDFFIPLLPNHPALSCIFSACLALL